MNEFFQHVNSMNAICLSLLHYIPCDPITDKLIECVNHLDALILILQREIEELKKEKENAQNSEG